MSKSKTGKTKKKGRKKPLTAKKAKKELLKILKNVFIAVGTVILVKVFVFDVGFVAQNSMYPTLEEGDIMLMKKWDVHFKTKGSGINFYDVVTIANMKKDEGEKENIVTRVIGLPGDSIKIVNGTVHRNGEAIEDTGAANIDTTVNVDCEISQGHIFVLGDNRSDSWDSVDFGEIPIEKVIGVVLFK